MKRKYILFTAALLVQVLSFGQISINGLVQDDDTGEPLLGATVMLTDGSEGTITDFEGKFTLKIPEESKRITVSYTGYQSRNIKLETGKVEYVIQLSAGEQLEEVIIVGYGDMRKSDLTGSVSKLSEDIQTARQYSGVDELLQGRIAGVNVSSNAGSPNGAVSVSIRGTNSLRGNNEPLYVIDGIIINSAAEDVLDASADANELQSAQNGLTGLNPRDIASIEILKDASATAIYGSRGANGVVLITTKGGSGINEGAEINLYATSTLIESNKVIDVLDPISYAHFQNDVREYDGYDPRYVVEGDQIYTITNYSDSIVETDPVPLEQVDWQDDIYKRSLSYNTGFSMSGKKKDTRYYFSAGFNEINGIVETTNLSKGDMRLNLNTDLSEKLSFDNRIGLTYQEGTFANGGSRSGGNRSFTKQILTYRPLIDTDAASDDTDLEISNPNAWLVDYDDLINETRVNVSSTMKYKIIKNLEYTLRGGVDFRLKDRERWYGLGIYKGGIENGVANYSNLNRRSYTIDNILTYKKRIKRKHNINATLAVTYDGNDKTNEIFEIADFPIKTLRSSAPQLGQIVKQPQSIYVEDQQIFSTLGRLNYTFRNRYILTASFRADQSSKFSKENQWGYFPSMAFAWRLGEEQFIKNLDIFYNLKLRMGFGMTGNQGINPYQTLATYSTIYYVNANGSNVIGSVPSRIPNPNLTWETTEQYNAGADISILGGDLNLTVDAYYKKTRDLLQNINLPQSTGFSSMTINRGSLENKGLELALDGVVYKRDEMEFSVGGHIAFNRNKVLDLGLPASTVWIDGEEREEIYYLGNTVSTGTYFKAAANIFMEGQPIGMFWGYETNGVYHDQESADAGPTYKGNPNKAGDLVFVDQNGDGNINPDDFTIIGNPNPDFTYGFDLIARFGRFSLKVLFDGVYGNEIANGYNLELGHAESQTKNILTSAYENAWSEENPDNSGTRVGYDLRNAGFVDLIVEDGSYLRLNILTLSYDIPVKKSFVKNLNVYASGRNLFYLTNYSGYEPQVTSFLYDGTIMGVDWVGTPNVRSLLFGINLTF
jgi:TonB-linked SusC/RagA family outer membrane protein